MKPSKSWAVGMCLLAMLACTEDLGPVTAAWNQLNQTMSANIAAAKRQLGTINGAVKALPAPAATDAMGTALRARLDLAVGSVGDGVNALDSFVTGSKASFDQAVTTGKVANVQKVIDDTKTHYDQLAAKLTASAANANGVIDKYRKHLQQLVDTDFTDLDFKKGTATFLFDRPTSKATLAKLVGYMNRCPELVVDLVGHTSNEGSDKKNVSLSVARAKAVMKYLVTKEKVEAKKFREVTGVGDHQNVVPEPPARSKEARAMGAAALAEARRKNRRITVHPVTPCSD